MSAGGASSSKGVLDTSTVISLGQQAEADFDPLPLDASAARAFGQVAASLRRTGRNTQVRAYDAMIAATAIGHSMVCGSSSSPSARAAV